jgi:hypothetical protein
VGPPEEGGIAICASSVIVMWPHDAAAAPAANDDSTHIVSGWMDLARCPGARDLPDNSLMSTRRALLLAGLFTAGRLCAQPEMQLNPAMDMVPLSQEAKVLGPQDRATLASWRARPDFYNEIRVTRRLNLELLDGKRITFVRFDGTSITFQGGPSARNKGTRGWVGLGQLDGLGHMAVAHAHDGVHGDLSENGRSWLVSSLPSRKFYIVARVTPLPVKD